MSNVTRRALRVYAALTELRGNDNDVLDALIPFFEPILAVMNGKIFDPHIFSAGVRKLYRWRFTGDIASQFIPRLHAKGFLRKEVSTKHGSIWLVQYTNAESNEVTSPNVTHAFEKIIDEFVTFSPRLTDLLSYNRNRDELKDILIRFLVSMNHYGEGAYAPELGNLEPGGQAGELLAQLEEGGQPLDHNDRYMCARFVQHLMQHKPEFAPPLARLASIALLTEVVEDFLKPTHNEAKTDLVIALDAPLALDYLGCSGKALKDDVATIILSLKKIGVSFVVFPISCVEMQRNLQTMLSLPTDQRRGYTHNAMIKGEVSHDYVNAVANNPERALDDAGIIVRPISLDSMPGLHRYFPPDLYEDLYSSILWGNNLLAREHDATCTALTMRLREGRQSSDLFKCRHVMVTRNPKFVRHVRKYCLQNRMINEQQEGPVILQSELATTAWLRTGLGADETIPRGHLIATCDRVLQTRPEVRSALAAQLAALTPERLQQFNVLMQDARSVQKLTDQTLNNEAVITAENASLLLDSIRQATAAELQERHEAELLAAKEASRKLEINSGKKITALTRELEQANVREALAKQEKMRQIKSAVRLVNRRSKILHGTLTSILVSLGLAGIANFFFHWFDGLAIWNLVLAAAGLLGICRLVFGMLEISFPGVPSLLNFYVRMSLNKQSKLMGIDFHTIQNHIEIYRGRAQWVGPEDA